MCHKFCVYLHLVYLHLPLINVPSLVYLWISVPWADIPELEVVSKFTIKEESKIANGVEFEKHPSWTPLMCFGDNEGSIRITKKRKMAKLAKHITIKHHHIRSLCEKGCIEPAYVNTKDQIADVMTKGLLPAGHLRICRKTMVLPERISQKQATQVADLVDIGISV